MAFFTTLSGQLNLNIQNFSNGLRTASNQARSFAATMNGTSNTVQQLTEDTFRWGLNTKSVSRVVSGILISQAFYTMLRDIRGCIDATFEFANALEYAKVAYSNLFGDTGLATEFINVLKDFAAKTPFSFSESEAAAKRLLAYGVQYKNVMYMMQGIMGAAAMQNDPSKVESISRAIGQIYTKGRLMGDEMKQLSEAGIPAYEILSERLGLTQKQLQNLGKEAIPASIAINALIDGMTDRFKGVVTASSRTLTGIISNIKDNALMLSAGIVEPFIGQMKAMADAAGKTLFTLREIFELKGTGGVFEKIVPKEAQATIRTFVANLMNLWTVVKYMLATGFEAFKATLYGVIIAFNAIMPVVNMTADVLVRLLYAVTQNATAMRWLTATLVAATTGLILFKAASTGSLVVKVLTAAIMQLAKALAFLAGMLSAHPVLALFSLITAGLVGLAIASSGAKNALHDLFGTLTGLNGVDPNSVLLPETKDRANDLEKFNNKLDDTADSMNKVADSTKKAAKSLFSFDEVFKLNDAEKGTSNPNAAFDIGNVGDYNLDDYIPEVPDMSGFGSDFVDEMMQSISDAFGLKQQLFADLINTGIGGLLGYVLGNLLGGPVGGVIGALAGSLVGYIWNSIANAIGLSDNERVSVPLGTFLGAAIGAVLGGPAGAGIGAAIGLLIGNLVGMIVDAITNKSFNTAPEIGVSLGTLLGLGIGYLVGGPPGALLGTAIGSLVGYVGGLIAKGFATGEWDFNALGLSLGTGIGAAIGAVVGGPPGAAIGAAIGSLVGWLFGAITDGFTKGKWDTSAISTLIGAGIGGAIGFVVGGPPGAIIGAAIGSLVGWISDYFCNTISGTSWTKIGEAFAEPFKSIFGPLLARIEEYFNKWHENAKTNLIEAGKNLVLGLVEGMLLDIAAIPAAIAALFLGICNALHEAFGLNPHAKTMIPIGENIVKGIIEGFTETVGSFVDNIFSFGSSIKDVVGGAFSDVRDTVKETTGDAYDAAHRKFSDTYETIKSSVGNVYEEAQRKFSDTASAIKKNVLEIYNATKENFDSSYSTVSDNVSKILAYGTLKYTDLRNTIKDNVTAAYNETRTKFSESYDAIKSNVTNAYNETSSKFSSIYTDIKNNVSDAKKEVTDKFYDSYVAIRDNATEASSKVLEKFSEIQSNIKTNVSNASTETFSKFSDIYNTISSRVSSSYDTVKTNFTSIGTKVTDTMKTMYDTVSKFTGSIYSTFTTWISDLWNNVFSKFSTYISNAIDGIKNFLRAKEDIDDDDPKPRGSSSGPSGPTSTPGATRTIYSPGIPGHAIGGVFNREHIARLNEGNKAEAVIPLENNTAMRPFVDAVARGVYEALAPTIVSMGSQSQNLAPLYVGTLIADDRGLKQLYKKFELIQTQENARRGITT